jgi:hypothetical protein
MRSAQSANAFEKGRLDILLLQKDRDLDITIPDEKKVFD